MNRYLSRSLALGCLGLGLMVSPLLGSIGIGNSAVPPNPKIGIVDLEDALKSTPAGKRLTEGYEKGRKAKQTLLDKQQEELKKANDDLEKQKSLLKPENYTAKHQELERKFVELNQTYLKLERELAEDNAKMIKDLFQQAIPKIAVIAKAEGVTVVLDKNAALWADPAVDLTPKLNAEMK
ncbi:MAG: OmpH family outer membrane protein [Deltaproteobacteria bacterium]|nr:MAG: OmpH family outer membrane protein [Deltaproteobacteria bacterium]